jgi:hypothetical protein
MFSQSLSEFHLRVFRFQRFPWPHPVKSFNLCRVKRREVGLGHLQVLLKWFQCVEQARVAFPVVGADVLQCFRASTLLTEYDLHPGMENEQEDDDTGPLSASQKYLLLRTLKVSSVSRPVCPLPVYTLLWMHVVAEVIRWRWREQ